MVYAEAGAVVAGAVAAMRTVVAAAAAVPQTYPDAKRERAQAFNTY